MIRNLRQLLKAYWKEQTKAAIKQKKSRLLIYDEHLKRFVSADELLIPNETYKANVIGGPASKRKSKDFLYDLLLKKFVNTRLDIFPLVGKNGENTTCNTNGIQKRLESVNITSRNLFWGKRNSKKKHRVKALPPVEEKAPLKDQDTNTGWAGQRTVDPETDPRPELRTSSDCPLGPNKRPDNKKHRKENNARKKLIVCAKESHYIAEKPRLSLIEDRNQSKDKKCALSSAFNLKKQHQTKASEVSTEDKNSKGDNIIKPRISISGKHNNDVSDTSINQCLYKGFNQARVSKAHSADGLSKGKPEQSRNWKKGKEKQSDSFRCSDLCKNENKDFPIVYEYAPSDMKSTKNRSSPDKMGKMKENPDKISQAAKKNKPSSCSSSENYRRNNIINENKYLVLAGSSENKVSQSLKKQNYPKGGLNIITSDCDLNTKDINKSVLCLEGTTNQVGSNISKDKPLSSQYSSSQANFKGLINTVTKCDFNNNRNEKNKTICPGLNYKSDKDAPIDGLAVSNLIESKTLRKEECETNITMKSCPDVPFKIQEQFFESYESKNNLNNCSKTHSLLGDKCISSINIASEVDSPTCKNVKPYCLKRPDLSNSSSITIKTPESHRIEQKNKSNSTAVDPDWMKQHCPNNPNDSNSILGKTESLKPDSEIPSDLSQSIAVLPTAPKPSSLMPPVSSSSLTDVPESPKSCSPSEQDFQDKKLTESRKPTCIKQTDAPHSIIAQNKVHNLDCLNKQNILNQTMNKTKTLKSTFPKQNSSKLVTFIKENTKPQGVQQQDLLISKPFITKPITPCHLSQTELSKNNDHHHEEQTRSAKGVLPKASGFGVKCTAKPISLSNDENEDLNDKKETKLTKNKEEHKPKSSKPCLNINPKHSGMDPQVSEKLEAITQDKCLSELRHNNDLNQLNGESYLGFKVIKSTAKSSSKKECKNDILECKHFEVDGSKKETKLKKSKNKKAKGKKKLKKIKTSLKDECLAKENLTNEQEQKSYSPIIEKSKPDTPLENQKAIGKKHKLDTITKLSSNMSSRHSRNILKKINHLIKFKKSICKRNNVSETLQPEKQEKGIGNELDKDVEFKPKKHIQLMEMNGRQSKSLTRATIPGKILNKDCPSSSKKHISLKTKKKNSNHIIDDKGGVMIKIPFRSKISIKKLSKKCNVCLKKELSNLTSNPPKKQMKLSDDMKVTKTSTKYLSSVKPSTAMPLKKKEVLMKASNYSLNSKDGKTQSVKSAQKKSLNTAENNRSLSETVLFKKSKTFTLSSQSIDKNTRPLDLLNKASNKIGDTLSNSQKTQKQGTSTKGDLGCRVKSSNNTVKVKEPNIVPIKAYTESHDLPKKMLNSSVKYDSKLASVTQLIKSKQVQKNAKVSQSVIFKTSKVKEVIKKSNSLTVLNTRHDKAAPLTREGIIKKRKETPGWVEKIRSNNEEVIRSNNKVIIRSNNANQLNKTPATTNTYKSTSGETVTNQHNIRTMNKSNLNQSIIKSSKESNQAMKNRNFVVKYIKNNNNEPRKKLNSLPYGVKPQTEDKAILKRVQYSSQVPQSKLQTGAKHIIKIKNMKTDRKLVKLSNKNLKLYKNIENGSNSSVNISGKIYHADLLPQKITITKKSVVPQKLIQAQTFLKDNGPFKALAPSQKASSKNTYVSENHLQVKPHLKVKKGPIANRTIQSAALPQKALIKDYNGKNNIRPSTVNIPNKDKNAGQIAAQFKKAQTFLKDNAPFKALAQSQKASSKNTYVSENHLQVKPHLKGKKGPIANRTIQSAALPQKALIKDYNGKNSIRPSTVNIPNKDKNAGQIAAQFKKFSSKHNIKQISKGPINILNTDTADILSRASLKGYGINDFGLVKSKTYNILPNKMSKTNSSKTKTFSVIESSIIPKRDNLLKSNTFTVLSRRSSREDKNRVACTIKTIE